MSFHFIIWNCKRTILFLCKIYAPGKKPTDRQGELPSVVKSHIIDCVKSANFMS